jgi:hypothetical protein
MDEEETLQQVKRFGTSQGLSKYLVDEVIKRRNYNIDNITLIVIDIKKLRIPRGSNF